jgi:hypothetical protein
MKTVRFGRLNLRDGLPLVTAVFATSFGAADRASAEDLEPESLTLSGGRTFLVGQLQVNLSWFLLR